MAQSFLQAGPVTAAVMEDRGNLRPRRVDAAHQCTYRVWRGGDDGLHVTFSEDDVFLGGITWFSDYKTAGISRAEAIAGIEPQVDRVWLAEATPDGTIIGPLVEQPLTYTAFKNVKHKELGLLVYQHRAFITQLPAGDYVSVWVGTYPGFPDETVTVFLHILPSGE
jgi:hypothetical protein